MTTHNTAMEMSLNQH